jgi:sugar phosphate isomerase/epimerase
MRKYSVILGNLGNTKDRFCGSYKEPVGVEEMFKRAAKLDDVKGMELVETWDVTAKTAPKMKKVFKNAGLECVSIIPDLFSESYWRFGSLSSREASVRKKSLEHLRGSCELCLQMDCELLNFWPAQDGYDYPLQGNFIDAWKHLAEGMAKLAAEFPSLKLALEYKAKEPRAHSLLPRMAECLLLCQQTGAPNLGVTIDTGHAFLAGENVAEAVALAKSCGDRLLHMHFNDNYKSWDDDMIAGSIHTIDYIELLFWLDECGYDGWLSMDQYPYREDAAGAINESLKWMKALDAIVSANRDKIRAAVKAGSPVETSALLRSLLT